MKTVYRELMNEKAYNKMIDFLNEDIERLLNIKSSKKNKKQKQLLNYFQILLKIAEAEKQSYYIIEKIEIL